MSETENPVDNPVPMREGNNGGRLKTGGNNGGGRPPNEFKQRMRELVSREDVEAYFEKCLKGEFGPKFHIAAVREASDRGYGKPVQELRGSFHHTFDPEKATDEQLERIANGEDPEKVLMDASGDTGEG